MFTCGEKIKECCFIVLCTRQCQGTPLCHQGCCTCWHKDWKQIDPGVRHAGRISFSPSFKQLFLVYNLFFGKTWLTTMKLKEIPSQILVGLYGITIAETDVLVMVCFLPSLMRLPAPPRSRKSKYKAGSFWTPSLEWKKIRHHRKKTWAV